jgi:hypothetical protein
MGAFTYEGEQFATGLIDLWEQVYLAYPDDDPDKGEVWDVIEHVEDALTKLSKKRIKGKKKTPEYLRKAVILMLQHLHEVDDYYGAQFLVELTQGWSARNVSYTLMLIESMDAGRDGDMDRVIELMEVGPGPMAMRNKIIAAIEADNEVAAYNGVKRELKYMWERMNVDQPSFVQHALDHWTRGR